MKSMGLRDAFSPAAFVDWLIVWAFRLRQIRLAEGLACWGKGNHKFQLVRCRLRNGPILWLNPSNYIDRVLLTEGEHDRHVIEALGEQLREGDVLWDVGANIGLIGLSLMHLHKKIQVVAFEPSPFTFCHLHLNNELHGYPMQLKALALADVAETRAFSVKINRNTGQNTLLPNPKLATYDTSIDVCCETGDRLIAHGMVPIPTLIKIDVEGAEAIVLRGLSDTLKLASLRAVVFEGPTADHEAILALLKDSGFSSVKRLTDNETQTNFLAVR